MHMLIETFNFRDGRKVEISYDAVSNTLFYKENVPGYPDNGRFGERTFSEPITEKTIKNYIKEIKEEIEEPV